MSQRSPSQPVQPIIPPLSDLMISTVAEFRWLTGVIAMVLTDVVVGHQAGLHASQRVVVGAIL